MRLGTLIAATALGIVSLVCPASAITARDVLDRMSAPERQAYIWGIVDTLVYVERAAAHGATPHSDCLYAWYYGDDPPGPAQVLKVFAEYRNETPASLIISAADSTCR